MKIGFPRAIFYFDTFPFWAGYFEALGIELQVSLPTNRAILEKGLKKASDDTCLPIKILSGHLASFSPDIEAVFLPRMVSIEEKTYLCPKILGLPESVLAAVPDGLRVLTVTVNWREGKAQVQKSLEKLGAELNKSKSEVRVAFARAQEYQREYEEMRRAGRTFVESMEHFESLSSSAAKTQPTAQLEIARDDSVRGSEEGSTRLPHSERCPTIALIGHPYLTYESYGNLNLLAKLKAKAKLVFMENVEQVQIEDNLKDLRKPLFWSQGKRLLGAGHSYAANTYVDGVIYLSCFGCGTDSMTQDMLARRARANHKPYMVLTLDEHSGEAGLITRVEAFLDMIERKGNGFAPHVRVKDAKSQ